MKRGLVSALALMIVAGAALASVNAKWFNLPYGYQTGADEGICLYYVDAGRDRLDVMVANVGQKQAKNLRVRLYDLEGNLLWKTPATTVGAGKMAFVRVTGEIRQAPGFHVVKVTAANLPNDDPADNVYTCPLK